MDRRSSRALRPYLSSHHKKTMNPPPPDGVRGCSCFSNVELPHQPMMILVCLVPSLKRGQTRRSLLETWCGWRMSMLIRNQEGGVLPQVTFRHDSSKDRVRKCLFHFFMFSAGFRLYMPEPPFEPVGLNRHGQGCLRDLARDSSGCHSHLLRYHGPTIQP